MMERLLTVTSGYLKFSLICMVGGAVVFALASLAISNPKAFLIVFAIGLVVFFIVRSEINSKRKSLEISRRNRNNPNAKKEADEEFAAFSAGLTAFSSLVLLTNDQMISVPDKVQRLLITQWAPHIDLKPGNVLVGDELAFAAKYIAVHSEELAKIGVYPFFVSASPSNALIKAMHKNPSARGWGNVVFTHHGSAKVEKPISIGFLSTRQGSWPEQLEKIMQDGFRIVRGDVLEATKS
jgi:hypothetical protein